MDPEGFFPLIVRGGRDIRAAHDGDTLNGPIGQVPGRGRRSIDIWPDATRVGGLGGPSLERCRAGCRKAEVEPVGCRERCLGARHRDRFWMFLSSNTNTGHFEAFRSEAAFMQGDPID